MSKSPHQIVTFRVMAPDGTELGFHLEESHPYNWIVTPPDGYEPLGSCVLRPMEDDAEHNDPLDPLNFFEFTTACQQDRLDEWAARVNAHLEATNPQ